MQLTKNQAQAVANSLKPCPFCGQRLDVSIRGAKEHAANPKARCTTEDCWGSKLPALPLDVPEFVAAYNMRWVSDYPLGTMFCQDCGCPETMRCSCPDSPMAEPIGSRERIQAIATARKRTEDAQAVKLNKKARQNPQTKEST